MPSVDLAVIERAMARAAKSGDAFGELARLRARAAAAAGKRAPSARDVERAEASYRKTHWGLEGERRDLRALRAADPRAGVYSALGELVSLVYRTRKDGDARAQEYEHPFADPLPVLAYCDDGNDHALAIAGGGYRVTWRGIVG